MSMIPRTIVSTSRQAILNSSFRFSYKPIISGASVVAGATRCYSTPAAEPVRDTLKPLDSRKTHLVDDYTRILRGNPILLITHYGGLLKNENQTIRSDIKKAGGRLIVTRSKLFQVALRGLEDEDPASKRAHEKYSRSKHPLSSYFSGPSAVVAIPEINPAIVKDVVKVLDKSGDRLILLGAYVDGSIQSRADVELFKELPTLDQLRANLTGVLTVLGGAGLVQTLEASSKVLYLTMESRKKDMEEPENGTAETKE